MEDLNDQCQDYNPKDFKGYYQLYASHFLTTWSDRLFEFASFIFITDVFENTLLPSSIYGFATTATAILFGGFVGKWVDKVPRLYVIRQTIPIQKLFIILSCTGFAVLLTVLKPGNASPAIINLIFAGIVVCGCGLNLATIANTISIEKDWTVIIANGETEVLTRLNASMRRIDLLCKMLSPLFLALLTSFKPLFAVLFIGAWSIPSVFLEYFLIRKVYLLVPPLSLPRPQPLNPQYSTINSSKSFSVRFKQSLNAFIRDFITFYRHPVFLSSLAYSMLYLTVLSPSGTMLAYLKSTSYSDGLIAAIRAAAVLSGLIATFLYPFFHTRIGLIRTGLWAIWEEVLFLTAMIVGFWWAEGKTVGKVLVVIGMVGSRLGLWGFDLVYTQGVQEGVEQGLVGVVNGWQYALSNFFDLLQYVTTMIWSDPSMFKIPATISLVMVFLAAIVFCKYARDQRGHLLHLDSFEKLLGNKER